MRLNFFSLTRLNGVSKSVSFYADFKNVKLTSVKRAPKKDRGMKPNFYVTFGINCEKTGF